MHRMEIRNAVLKGRMDARARYFGQVDVMRLQWETFKRFVPGGSFHAPVMSWR